MPNPLTPDTIKARREALNLTQLELAGAIYGATPSEIDQARRIYSILANVKKWEQGKATPQHANAAALRRILNEP